MAKFSSSHSPLGPFPALGYYGGDLRRREMEIRLEQDDAIRAVQ
jgi:hypothetical protein